MSKEIKNNVDRNFLLKTNVLFASLNTLSAQQMVAYYMLIMVHKITITGKPAYLAGRLKLRKEDERELRGWGGRMVEILAYSLETSRAGFVYRGGRLYNSLSRNPIDEMSCASFSSLLPASY